MIKQSFIYLLDANTVVSHIAEVIDEMRKC